MKKLTEELEAARKGDKVEGKNENEEE